MLMHLSADPWAAARRWHPAGTAALPGPAVPGTAARTRGDEPAFLPAAGRTPRYAFAELPVIASIPRGPDEEIVDGPRDAGTPRRSPDAGGRGPAPDAGTRGPGDAGAPANCNTPSAMSKVVSGAFQGGWTMDDYYPDLAGGGYYLHPGSGGPFNTGSRVGASAQLYGTVPAACAAGQYTLGQTVHYARAIFNGVPHARQGQTWDDIAASGRDASRPPFRREWTGGGNRYISMADPPSVGYGASSNIEFDRDFVTSLAGPGGSVSVSWSTSIRVVGGSVTRNNIT